MPRESMRLNDENLYRAIRKAWKQGENPTKLVVDGVEHELWIRSITRKATFSVGPGGAKNAAQQSLVHREETWLVASPKDKLLPVFSVEPKPGCNSRVMVSLL